MAAGWLEHSVAVPQPPARGAARGILRENSDCDYNFPGRCEQSNHLSFVLCQSRGNGLRRHARPERHFHTDSHDGGTISRKGQSPSARLTATPEWPQGTATIAMANEGVAFSVVFLDSSARNVLSARFAGQDGVSPMEKGQVVAADRQVARRNGQVAAPNGQVRARFSKPAGGRSAADLLDPAGFTASLPSRAFFTPTAGTTSQSPDSIKSCAQITILEFQRTLRHRWGGGVRCQVLGVRCQKAGSGQTNGSTSMTQERCTRKDLAERRRRALRCTSPDSLRRRLPTRSAWTILPFAATSSRSATHGDAWNPPVSAAPRVPQSLAVFGPTGHEFAHRRTVTHLETVRKGGQAPYILYSVEA